MVDFTVIRPPLHCVWAAPPTAKASARQFPLQRTKLHKNWSRAASARADDHALQWRRESRELRVEVQELQAALADAWMQDEMQLMELEKLISALADVLHARCPAEGGNVVGNVELPRSEARDREPSGPNLAIGRSEDESNEIVRLGIEGANEHDDNAIKLSELQAKQEGLSTLRRLKRLNVHDYVHNALRTSHMRSWLRSRGITE